MLRQQEPTYWVKVEVNQLRNNSYTDKEHSNMLRFMTMLLSSIEAKGFSIASYEQKPEVLSIDLIKICLEEQDKDVEEFLHFLAGRIKSRRWPVKISLRKFPIQTKTQHKALKEASNEHP